MFLYAKFFAEAIPLLTKSKGGKWPLYFPLW